MSKNKPAAYFEGISYGSLPKMVSEQLKIYSVHIESGGRPYRLDKFAWCACPIIAPWRVFRVDPEHIGNHEIIVAWFGMKLYPGDIFINGAICGSEIRAYYSTATHYFRAHQKARIYKQQIELIHEIDREYYDAVLDKYCMKKDGDYWNQIENVMGIKG